MERTEALDNLAYFEAHANERLSWATMSAVLDACTVLHVAPSQAMLDRANAAYAADKSHPHNVLIVAYGQGWRIIAHREGTTVNGQDFANEG